MDQKRYPKLGSCYPVNFHQPKCHICQFEVATDLPTITIDILTPKELIIYRCKICGRLRAKKGPSIKRKGMKIYDTTKRVSNNSDPIYEEWKHFMRERWVRKE